jgi:large subunit ribosomal protein L3
MKKGILGQKEGMTQVFTKTGKLIPVTVISVEPNVVMQIKTNETDGYEAIQLGFSTKKEKLSNKPEIGHAKKANAAPKRFLKEIRGVDVANYQQGQELKADTFEVGEMVDVTGTSKGKGFQGVIKRYNQTRGPMGHGSQYHRGVGSLGTRLPMHVLKGKKMPGHMGNATVTVQNLEIVGIDLENNLILVKGNVPGPKKSFVIIRTAVKNPDTVNEREELIDYNELIEQPIEENIVEEVAEEVEETTKEVVEEIAEEVVEQPTEEVKEETETSQEKAE